MAEGGRGGGRGSGKPQETLRTHSAVVWVWSCSQEKPEVRGEVREEVREEVRGEVREEVRGEVREEMRGEGGGMRR